MVDIVPPKVYTKPPLEAHAQQPNGDFTTFVYKRGAIRTSGGLIVLTCIPTCFDVLYDPSGAYWVVYVQAGVGYLYWYDPRLGTYATLTIGACETVFISVRDITTWFGGSSALTEVLLHYTLAGVIMRRTNRDYFIEPIALYTLQGVEFIRSVQPTPTGDLQLIIGSTVYTPAAFLTYKPFDLEQAPYDTTRLPYDPRDDEMFIPDKPRTRR